MGHELVQTEENSVGGLDEVDETWCLSFDLCDLLLGCWWDVHIDRGVGVRVALGGHTWLG